MQTIRNRFSSLRAHARLARDLAQCLADPYRPLMAHMIVTRRCNLSCGYCHEYDKTSAPVPLAELKARVRLLAELGTVFVTLTGGESLLHPQIVELVRYVADQGMTPVMNSNGYLLHETLVRELNDAGLYAMQISIDNVHPTAVSKKSLKPLLPKLRVLAEHARFRVRINTVLGSGSAQEVLEVASAVTALGFDAKCSLVRNSKGAFIPLDDEERAVYDAVRALARSSSSYLSEDFQTRLLDESKLEWKCRSGARYFTVCEDGLVHLCESSYNSPGTPLARYTREHIKQAFDAKKSCAPTCSVAYAHQASRMDSWRAQGHNQRVPKLSWKEADERRLLRVV